MPRTAAYYILSIQHTLSQYLWQFVFAIIILVFFPTNVRDGITGL